MIPRCGTGRLKRDAIAFAASLGSFSLVSSEEELMCGIVFSAVTETNCDADNFSAARGFAADLLKSLKWLRDVARVT